MKFDWKLFLEVATYSVGDDIKPETEAWNRTAISRAYYSAFNLARNYLLQSDPEYRGLERFLKDTQGSHNAVITRLLDKTKSQEERILGGMLKELRISRNIADYDEDVKITFQWANSCVISTELLVNQLKRLIEAP